MTTPSAGSDSMGTSESRFATARASANIALVKYWGKRDVELNLPAVGSISITLAELWSETRVMFPSPASVDEFYFDGAPDEKMAARVFACLDVLSDNRPSARVESRNNFPTAAGLASSASGFAALVAAANRALGANLDDRSLSMLARQGSGSAARSIFGGFVELHRGQRSDGGDCFAEPLLAPGDWPLEVVIGLTDTGPKTVGSTDGMRMSESSPYFDPWVSSHSADLMQARTAIGQHDFESLAEVSERSCLKMHSLALASGPGLMYWRGATVEGMRRVRDLRGSGVAVFFTVDAGPQIKAVCEPDATDQVCEALAQVPGVNQVLTTGLGRGIAVE